TRIENIYRLAHMQRQTHSLRRVSTQFLGYACPFLCLWLCEETRACKTAIKSTNSDPNLGTNLTQTATYQVSEREGDRKSCLHAYIHTFVRTYVPVCTRRCLPPGLGRSASSTPSICRECTARRVCGRWWADAPHRR